MKEQHITCECGHKIDTSNRPLVVTCKHCGSQHQKQGPKLLFMGVQEETFPAGVVII